MWQAVENLDSPVELFNTKPVERRITSRLVLICVANRSTAHTREAGGRFQVAALTKFQNFSKRFLYGFKVLDGKRRHAAVQPLFGNGANLVDDCNCLLAAARNGHE
jgi:hypothetical protein